MRAIIIQPFINSVSQANPASIYYKERTHAKKSNIGSNQQQNKRAEISNSAFEIIY